MRDGCRTERDSRAEFVGCGRAWCKLPLAHTIWVTEGFPSQPRDPSERRGYVCYAPQLEVGLDLGDGLDPAKRGSKQSRA